jgi:hypothetical protein
MIMNSREASTYKLFIMLNITVLLFTLFVCFSYWNPDSVFIRLGNIIILLLVLFSFLLYGKYSFSPIRVMFFLFCTLIYIVKPGMFSIGVPLVPLLGLFLMPKNHNFNLFSKKFKKRAKILSAISLLAVYFILYIAKLKFGGNTDNYISIVAIYVIALNIIFFRGAFSFTVLLAVVLSSLFTPGAPSVQFNETSIFGIPNVHQGNRSGVFLLLFLFNMKFIKYIYHTVIKKKYFMCFILALIPFTIFIESMIREFLMRFERVDVYSDPRFQWFGPLLNLFFYEGPTAFFNNGAQLLSDLGNEPNQMNPHNSFFYLLLVQYWLGLLKILLFIFSILIIPISAWFAIAGRATFDPFLLLGPIDIFLVVMVSVLYNAKFKFKPFKSVTK